MRKSKVHMPKKLEKKCHAAIHPAMVASTVAGAAPIPISDAIPITAAQIAMIVALGKVFDVSLSKAAAKSIIGVGVTQQVGRAVAAAILKMIPVLGSAAGAATAAAITEALGWIVADDFYRMSQGDDPEDLIGVASDLKSAFEGFRI